MNTTSSLLRNLGALLMVMLLVACAGTTTRESTGEYIDDTTITMKVKTALLNDSQVKAREVSVETFKGIVQLSGFVSNSQERAKAEDIARGVTGVKSVKNDIRLK